MLSYFTFVRMHPWWRFWQPEYHVVTHMGGLTEIRPGVHTFQEVRRDAFKGWGALGKARAHYKQLIAEDQAVLDRKIAEACRGTHSLEGL